MRNSVAPLLLVASLGAACAATVEDSWPAHGEPEPTLPERSPGFAPDAQDLRALSEASPIYEIEQIQRLDEALVRANAARTGASPGRVEAELEQAKSRSLADWASHYDLPEGASVEDVHARVMLFVRYEIEQALRTEYPELPLSGLLPAGDLDTLFAAPWVEGVVDTFREYLDG